MPMPPTKSLSNPGLTAKGEPRQFVKHAYKDRITEDDGPLSKKDEIVLAQYDEDRVGGIFPLKLHIILKILEREGKDHIFSWLPHGRAFGIHKLGLFEEEVMKRFFKQSQISSFRRQLNLYGFLRLSNGRDSGAYYHELFLRGRPLLSMKMIRTRIKGTKIRASSSPADEPQFYSMPFLGPGIRTSAHNHSQERNNSLMMMRANLTLDNHNSGLDQNRALSPPSLNNSTHEQLSLIMNRNLINSFMNNTRSTMNSNASSSTISINAVESLYRSLDQRRSEFRRNNDLGSQLLNNRPTMNSRNILPGMNDMNSVANIMAQARYLDELSRMSQRFNGAMSSNNFSTNNQADRFLQTSLPSSFMINDFEKPKMPLSQRHGEDIAITSMLSMCSDGSNGAVKSLEI